LEVQHAVLAGIAAPFSTSVSSDKLGSPLARNVAPKPNE
jgi:hypothetical protein